MNKITIIIILLLAASSCTKRNALVMQAGDEHITIQAMKLNDDNDSVMSFQARLIPHIQETDDKDTKMTERLQYGMDSCFYFKKGDQKVYAPLIQCIPSTVKGRFEYLVQFDNMENTADKKIALFYHDKYFTKKTYKLDVLH